MRKKHHKSLRPTGDASARYERSSHSGATWYDLMPAPANGADSGTPGFWPAFDGVSGVDLGQPVKLDFAGAFTCSFWAKQATDAPTGSERIVARDGGGRSWLVQFADPSGSFQSFMWGVGFPAPGYRIVTTPGNPLAVWHYAVFVNEGAGNDLVNFIDGVEQARAVGGGGAPVLPANNTQIGQDNATGPKFQGELDTVRLFPRALSSDEILRDYNAGKAAHL